MVSLRMPIYEIGTKKVLFIHIPKTGGASLSSWLSEKGKVSLSGLLHSSTFKCNPQHFTFQDIKTLFPDHKWDFVFTVVRNPYKRIASEFQWRMQLISNAEQPLVDFSLWIDCVLNKYAKNLFYLDNHLRSQIDFIDSNIVIYHYEDGISNVAQKISTELGIENDFEDRHLNSSVAKEVTWTFRSNELMERHYRRDFEVFGYKRHINTL